MNCRQPLIALAIAPGLSATPAAYAMDLGEFNDTKFSIGGYFKAGVPYEKVNNRDTRIVDRSNQFCVNLIHNITQDLKAGEEWRKYNLAFGPLLPEGQQVEVMPKYKF
ncbi:hypothetical protein [Marinobacter sp.]|jgi:hypothetical protein|uniref:hypothetical protein n=1 Tax=Marinobacter sp. TaxID=50741 RepID=UPI0025BAA1A9|nr:hypothetical protein [Marinobacter sp.]|tara:strand:+ start:234 stop:557 length:324 start_codon:yes stop_codon:yes gene_type:complete